MNLITLWHLLIFVSYHFLCSVFLQCRASSWDQRLNITWLVQQVRTFCQSRSCLWIHCEMEEICLVWPSCWNQPFYLHESLCQRPWQAELQWVESDSKTTSLLCAFLRQQQRQVQIKKRQSAALDKPLTIRGKFWVVKPSSQMLFLVFVINILTETCRSINSA